MRPSWRSRIRALTCALKRATAGMLQISRRCMTCRMLRIQILHFFQCRANCHVGQSRGPTQDMPRDPIRGPLEAAWKLNRR